MSQLRDKSFPEDESSQGLYCHSCLPELVKYTAESLYIIHLIIMKIWIYHSHVVAPILLPASP